MFFYSPGASESRDTSRSAETPCGMVAIWCVRGRKNCHGTKEVRLSESDGWNECFEHDAAARGGHVLCSVIHD